MNKRALFFLVLLVALVLGGSYYATNLSLNQGSVFNLDPAGSNANDSNVAVEDFSKIKETAENQPKTPTDYALVQLNVYLPPEKVSGASSADPSADVDFNGIALSEGAVSKSVSSGEAGRYVVQGVVQNLGSTLAKLPQLKIILNGEEISDVSGVVNFGRVRKDGVVFTVTLDESGLKDSNTLEAVLDPNGLITESSEANNTVRLVF